MISFLKRLDVRVSVSYGIVATLWILFSDTLMTMLFGSNPSLLAAVSLIKGQAFVAVTTLALFFVLSIELRKRNRVELNLQKNKVEHRLILDNMIEGAQIISYDWKYLYLNDTVVRQSQQSRQDLLGYTMMERYPGIENTEAFAAIQQCMENRIPNRIENEFIYPNGSTRWFELSIEPIPEGVFILSLDITDRKQHETLLKESEQKLRLFIENAPSAIAMLDREMKHILVSNRWLRDYRLEGNIIGVSHYEVFPDLPERWKEIHQRCLQGAVEKSDADIFPRADGTVDWVRWEVHPWYYNNGEIGGIVIFSEVITERILAEQALNNYAQRMQILHEIDLGLISGESTNELLYITLKHLRQMIPCQRAAIIMFDSTITEATIYATDFTPPFTIGESILNTLSPNWIESFKSSQSRTFDDMRLADNLEPVEQKLIEVGLVSVFQVLLYSEGQPIGMLSLNASQPNFFTSEHKQLATEVANQLAIAIQQMRLQDATKRHVEELKQTQAALQASEVRYRRVVEDQTDPIARYNTDLEITFVNRHYAALFDKTSDEMIGARLPDIVPIDVRQSVIDHIKSIDSSNAVATHENKIGSKQHWFQWTDRALLNDKGEIIEYQAVGRDINELKQLQFEQKQQLELLESMWQFLQATLNAMPSNTAVVNPIGTIINVNNPWKQFAEMNGGEADTHYLGENYLEVCDNAAKDDSEGAELIASAIRDIIAGREDDFYYEYPCNSSAQSGWFGLRITPFDESPPRHIVISHTDITARRLVEQSEQEQRRLAEAMRDSLATLTTALDVETALEQILAYSSEILPTEAGTIILFENDHKGRVVCSRGFSEDAEQFFKENLIPMKSGKFLHGDEHYIVMDTQADPNWVIFPHTDWVRSSIAVSLKIRGQSVGLLIADSAIPNNFQQKDLENLQAFAHYATLALEAANYVDKLEQRVQERTTELQTAKDHAEAILNNSPDGIALLYRDFAIQQTNASFNRIFKCEPDEYINKSLISRVHEDDKQRFTERLKTIIAEDTGQGGQIEVRAIRKDNMTIDIEMSVGLVKGNGLVCVIRDISERKAQQRELRYHANLQQNVSDAVVVTDMEQKIQSWNRAAERIYGWHTDEAIGQLVGNVLQTDMSSDVAKQSFLQLQQVGWWYGEVVQHHKDGTPIHVLSSVTLIADEKGDPMSMVAVNHDITERKQAEDELNARIAEELEFQAHLKALNEITIELTQINDLDIFFRRAIELGLNGLGFERLAIFLYDEQDGLAQGTYGTNEDGEIINEKHLQFTPEPGGTLLKAFEKNERFHLHDNRELYNELKPVGKGWNAIAVIWNGVHSLGWLVADNLLSQEPPSSPQLDTLGLYAMTIGSLLGQKRVQQALRGSEFRYRLLAENILDLVIQTNEIDELIFASPSSRSVLGYAPEELIGKKSLDFIHPDDKVIVRKTLTEAIQADDSRYSVLVRARHKQGHYVWLETDGRPIRSETTQELEGFISSSRDVSDRVFVEQALRDSEEQFRLLVEAAPLAIVITNFEGRIRLLNDQAEQLFGYDRLELVDDPIEVLVPQHLHRNDPTFNETYVGNLNVRPMSIGLELEAQRKDGTRFPAEVELSYVETGNDLLVMNFIVDITERKAAEESLKLSLAKEKELGELKTRFVSMASHEFRTPLATIMALAETISTYRHKLSDTQIDERLEKIKDQIEHLKAIMEDVLLLGRMQSHRIILNPSLVDLDSLCRSVIDEFANREDIPHQLDYSCNLQPIDKIKVDRKLIRQIVNNVVSNAIKYSPPDKSITIKLEYADSSVVLTVQDEGIGIPEADLKHLFEPFHRASNVGTISGTGLGLVITKEAVDLHGGTIKVESEVNKGTTFIIRIPMSDKLPNEENNTDDQDIGD